MNKILAFTFLMTCFLSCHDEINDPIDHCPTCSSSIKVNDVKWPSKPDYAWYQINEKKDTFFTFLVTEVNPTHDPYKDSILGWMIPYNEGEFRLDSLSYANDDRDMGFYVFEAEYGTPAQFYLPLYNEESSSVIIQHLDKKTGEFILSLDLALYPFGIVNGHITNSTYPDFVRIEGEISGNITIK